MLIRSAMIKTEAKLFRFSAIFDVPVCTSKIMIRVTVINNHSLGSILNFTLLDLVKQTKVTNTVYAIETKKISVCRYDLFM